MSKTFDEGGAKGLLLANLGVSNSGCKIVFDSTLDTEETPAPLISKECLTDQDQDPGIQDEILAPKPTVDVSGLVGKLENLLSSAYGSYSNMENIPLVPQLASLRNQYAELREGGFIETGVVFSDRYASSTEEEAEADKSIHLEAIERSQASQADLGRSRISRESTETYGAVEDNDHYTNSFGYGCDDDNLFEDLHDDDHRYSSSSFQGARASTGDVAANEGSKLSRPTFSQASLLLDAIASGDISTTQPGNHYEFFNTQALESLSTGNWWAGAGHWKKIPSKRRYKSSPGIIGGNSSNSSGGIEKNARLDLKKRRGRNTKTKSLLSPGSKMLVSISESTKSLEDLLERSKCKHLKNTTNSFQLTKAMQTKYGKADNLLPVDAGLGIKELGTLFLRPKIGLTDMVKAKQEVEDTMEAVSRTRAVGFGGTETWGVDDDSLYGASDDGVGFDVVDTDTGKDEVHDKNEFVIPDLEDIRKVNRIKIGYATMARKVDVKRLKKDLWTELEQTFVSKTQDDIERNKNSGDLSIKKTASDEKFRGSNSYDEFDDDIRSNAKIQPTNIAQSLSFQDTVRDMQANQSQPDVTLPFYFICILHLCNEKGLSLESSGLEDFVIHSA
ncbi:unnamed protein product [Pseudo-nitzschia multistriata]|uniref:Condensin complex subunit 2 n=1 Tax=Pseudo-nitzschia multistriata TaxID=183589 RepID=A0A448ZQ22_9STRA|nr:unnamed protein product [Pseudo-nitzschia multistriata]